jgi:hypothetical protein
MLILFGCCLYFLQLICMLYSTYLWMTSYYNTASMTVFYRSLFLFDIEPFHRGI